MHRLVLTPAAVLLALLLLASPARADWVWPLHGEVITPYRNGDDPYAAGQHRGIDIAGDVGAPVVAATPGDVRFAGIAGSSGLTVSVRTSDGRYDTSYLHLSAVAVHKGDRVAAGQRVGNVGTTGVRSAAQPHLHFGVRDAGTEHAYHDPLDFLPPPSAAPESPREAPATQPAPTPARPTPAAQPVQAPATPRVPAARHAPAGRHAPKAHRAPEWEPSPEPRHAPRSNAAPEGHRLPTGRRVTTPTAAPSPRRQPAARHGPAAGVHPQHAPAGSPSGHTGHDGRSAHDAGQSQRAPSAGPAGATSAGGAQSQTPAPEREDLTRPPHAGLDLGLVLACVGVLLSAVLLGLTEDGRQATRSGGERIRGLLRPLVGRREAHGRR